MDYLPIYLWKVIGSVLWKVFCQEHKEEISTFVFYPSTKCAIKVSTAIDYSSDNSPSDFKMNITYNLLWLLLLASTTSLYQEETTNLFNSFSLFKSTSQPVLKVLVFWVTKKIVLQPSEQNYCKKKIKLSQHHWPLPLPFSLVLLIYHYKTIVIISLFNQTMSTWKIILQAQ